MKFILVIACISISFLIMVVFFVVMEVVSPVVVIMFEIPKVTSKRRPRSVQVQ